MSNSTSVSSKIILSPSLIVARAFSTLSYPLKFTLWCASVLDMPADRRRERCATSAYRDKGSFAPLYTRIFGVPVGSGFSKRESSQKESFLGLPVFPPNFFFGFKTYPLHDSHCLSPLTGLHLVRVISNFSMLQKTILGIYLSSLLCVILLELPIKTN